MMDETPEPVASTGNMPEYSVTELSGLLKRTVETAFPYVRVRGELSRVTRPASGHCYFELKDERAVISGIVWKGSYARLKVKPEQGLEVVCTGKLTTFEGQSKYQIIVEQMELAGLGALMAMLEERKKRLAAEGLFDAGRKKPIPFLPRVVGVITSPTGAVIRDILHRLADRCPRHVVLWPVSVQGEKAPAEIAAAIRGFNALPEGGAIPRPDVLIVARGGGSFEDLLAFSEEIVVRAAAESAIPLISAVGHETDTTLIDFASDRRAPTPTAAAEMAVPVLRDLIDSLIGLERRLFGSVSRCMEVKEKHLAALARVLPRSDALFAMPRQRFDNAAERLRSSLFQNVQRHRNRFVHSAAVLRPNLLKGEVSRCNDHLNSLDARLTRAYAQGVRKSQGSLDGCTRVLESVSYRSVLARGFALVRGEGGIIKRRAGTIADGESLVLTFSDGDKSVVEKTKASSASPRSAKPKPGQGDLF